MPTLRGTLDVFGRDPAEPCRWCGEPTLTKLEPEGGSATGLIPLHAVCGAELIVLFGDLRAGRFLPPDVRARLERLGEPG